MRRVNGQLVVSGKVQRNRLGRRNPVLIRRILCGRTELVGSAVPSRSGAYTVGSGPERRRLCLYRAESRILAKPRSKRYVTQYARGVVLRLSGATG